MAEKPEDDKKEMAEDTKEESKEEKMEEVELEAEYSEEVKAGCHAAGGKYVCKAGEYAIYSMNDKLYASKADNFEEKFEVCLDMRFAVQTIKTGGAEINEPGSLAPIKVSFENNFNKMSKDMEELEAKTETLSAKISELQGKLDTYKCKELSNKFDEIAFDANITVTERTEWKNRINKNEFACEDELVEKFGGYVFKKNIENKFNSYTSETITEKVNNKKAYEELIDSYMADK